MGLDSKVIRELNSLAELVSSQADDKALVLINNVKLSSSNPYIRAEYLKYYFKAKHNYKTEQIIDSLDLFKKDI